MQPLKGNKEIEAAAIDWVIELEHAAGRKPRDSRYLGEAADIDSPPRLIEVKAVGKESMRSDGFLWLETRQVEEARLNPNFYVYLVENVRQGDPGLFKLRVFGGDLRRLLARAREKRYFELPLPVADYDAAARLGDVPDLS